MSMTWSRYFSVAHAGFRQDGSTKDGLKFLLRKEGDENGSSMQSREYQEPVVTVMNHEVVLELTRSSSQISHHPLPAMIPKSTTRYLPAFL
jgi:hypothetical protein